MGGNLPTVGSMLLAVKCVRSHGDVIRMSIAGRFGARSLGNFACVTQTSRREVREVLIQQS